MSDCKGAGLMIEALPPAKAMLGYRGISCPPGVTGRMLTGSETL